MKNIRTGGASANSGPTCAGISSRASASEDNVLLGLTSSISPLKGTMCSPKAKLIIELDGHQHLEQKEYDEERTKYLESQGYKVIRFWNNQVMDNVERVIKAITYALELKLEDKE